MPSLVAGPPEITPLVIEGGKGLAAQGVTREQAGAPLNRACYMLLLEQGVQSPNGPEGSVAQRVKRRLAGDVCVEAAGSHATPLRRCAVFA
jgi:hypothetical protein